MSSVSIAKLGNMVTLSIDTGTFMLNNYEPGSALFIIPEKFRPRTNVNFGCISSYNNVPTSYPLGISTSGHVAVYGPVAKATSTIAYYGAITYPL